MRPLTRQDLDGRRCEAPGCDHKHDHEGLVFSQRCHPMQGTLTSYHEGVVSITCAICGKGVADIAVAATNLH